MLGTGQWESWFIFIMATLSIVIANHHHHQQQQQQQQQHQPQSDNSIDLHPHTTERSATKRGKNDSLHFQDEISLQLPRIRVPHLRHHHVTHWGPYFENIEDEGLTTPSGVRHVTFHLGTTAMLDCRVAMLSDKTVMWMRRNGERVSLLTVAKSTYSSDNRYSLNFQYPNNWRLSISSVQRDDHGLYVCQVNTHPPRMQTTNVTILAPEIRIVDEAGHEVKDRYYKTGSGVELTCIVKTGRQVVAASKVLPTWFKNGQRIPDHVKVYHVNGTEDNIVTRFYVDRVTKSDSGEYTCSFDEHSASLVHLHVLNGEKQAAVHHDQWNSAKIVQESTETILILLVLIFSDLLSIPKSGDSLFPGF